ncbi:MAG TPA: ATP-binding protein [Thermodesulfovibrionales bacterium]|nr:ATP-binding protein [Thermodesulfovibrionales bacterium]
MKTLRFNIIIASVLILTIIAFGVELHYMKLGSVSFFTKLTILILLNITIIALFTLIFFVGKSLTKLYLERRNRVLGYKFKTKLVVILVVLTLIPASILFVVSSGLITNYIDRWFAPQLRQPLDSSVEIAKAFYELEKQRALDLAKKIPKGETPAGNYTVRHLTEIPKDSTETVRAAFEGKAGAEVISGENGDRIRAVVPENHGGKLKGVIVVESLIPKKITANVENIKDAYEKYLTLESWKVPIKTQYLLILGFLTILVVFMALWVALKIAGGITDPIQSLAQATEQVAAGNLDINVDLNQKDEIGLLVNSFNHMVKELKEGKESLHSAYIESDRRRLFMENILDNINSGVIMLDTAGNVLMINGAASSILNIHPDAALNKHYKDLMSMIKSEGLQNLIKEIEGREFRWIEREVKIAAGDRKAILKVFIKGLKDSQQYIGLLVVFDDITDIIKAQKAVAWQEVARRIAHEIKNPLTPIKLSAERLIKKWESRDSDFNQIFEHSTKTIIREVEGLKRLVDEFSKFSKMPEIKKTPTNMPMIIDEVVNLYKGYKGVEINVLLPKENPLVELDGEQFKRVMINIFDNAIHAISNKGIIDVRLHFDLSSNIAYLDIADDGPGIREEDKEKLFFPYFSTKKDGTGLGLAIANRIITEHKGYIKVRDRDPKGTIFTIEIPIGEK